MAKKTIGSGTNWRVEHYGDETIISILGNGLEAEAVEQLIEVLEQWLDEQPDEDDEEEDDDE